MTIATGIAKQLRYKKETAFAVPAPTAIGQQLRRVTSNLDLKKSTYASKEIRPDYQTADFRHGVLMVDGTISGELSVGTYADFIATAVRQAWQAPSTTGAILTVAATTAGPQYSRSTGSFLTDGFKVGDVVRWSGWATTAVNNNTRNFYITALSALTMSGVHLDGTPVGTKIAGDTVTCSVVGKKAWMPLAGQTNDSYTIEHWFSDIGQSEAFTGCRLSQLDIKLPATGMATIDLQFMGQSMTTAQAAYFTTANPVNTGAALASVNGALFVGSLQVGLVTGLNFSVKANMTAGEAVGSNVRPDIFAGKMDVTGQMTVYFQDNVMRDLFVNETEASLQCVFTTNNTATADFMAFTLPRIKMGGAAKDDGEKGLVMTMPFQALLNVAGGAGFAGLATTLSIQDSTVP